MYRHKFKIISGFLFLVIFFNSIQGIQFESSSNDVNLIPNFLPEVSMSNFDLLEDILNNNLNQFSLGGYFSQEFRPSLEATYYALFILEKLGKLTQINFQEISDFIMSYYNSSTKLFIDDYTKRYFDTNISLYYYPYNSLLLSNCYATLALKIIDDLELIDTSAMSNFIWSCYNPETSGFIGRPYSLSLQSEWRLSTMDNTYYAVLTYNVLAGENWNSKATEREKLIDFVESLQDNLRGGGFHNDANTNFASLQISEPNILASYFCIKTLQIFNWISAIDLPAFHGYLEDLYHPEGTYFEITAYPLIPNKSSIVTTALGLALSDLTQYTSIDRNSVLQFILSNRNPEGGFYRSPTFQDYELLDLYHIICGLEDGDELNELTIGDKQELADFLILYQHYTKGYTPASCNYMTINLIHSIVGSLKLFERENELEIQNLYTIILKNLRTVLDNYGFIMSGAISSARIQPLEIFTIGNRQQISEVLMPLSHKSTYFGLKSLFDLRKLNDLANSYNLTYFIQGVLNTQFLDMNYPQNYGAFSHFYTNFNPSKKNALISVIYSFYAVKILEFLAEYLNLGAITSLEFDVDALATYITRHIDESTTELFFNEGYSTLPEDLLEDTFYGIYILKAINRYSLNSDKIRLFILNNINYSNIKSVYFSFKLAQLLDLNILFDIQQTHQLIQDIYSAELHEFYCTTANDLISQEAVFYISEMAKTDSVRILTNYPAEVPLGGSLNMSAELCNLVLKDFGPYTTVKIESDQLGTKIMEIQADYSFKKQLTISAVANNYPSVTGEIVVYDSNLKVTSFPFEIPTTYDSMISIKKVEDQTKISLAINASLVFATGMQPIFGGKAFIKVYKGQLHIDSKNFLVNDLLRYTEFTLDYYPAVEGIYEIEVYLDDGIDPASKSLGNYTYICEDPDYTGGYRTEANEFLPLIIFLGITPGLALIFSYKKDLPKRLIKKLSSKK